MGTNPFFRVVSGGISTKKSPPQLSIVTTIASLGDQTSLISGKPLGPLVWYGIKTMEKPKGLFQHLPVPSLQGTACDHSHIAHHSSPQI